MSAIEDMLEAVPHQFKNLEADDVVRVLEEEIKSSGADLLIMVPYKYGFLESLIHRSKARLMASNNNFLAVIPII